MRLVRPSFEIIEQSPGLEGIYKQIELAGRTCYKSEDRTTEDSAKKFVDMLITRGHTSCLEHGTVYLAIPHDPFSSNVSPIFKYRYNPYSKVVNDMPTGPVLVYVTTNYRVLYENDWLDDLQYLCEPTEYHEKRVTVKFTSNIHFYKDITRHRPMSFAIESTRYCNYSKGKFGNELTFISPVWANEEELAKYGSNHLKIRGESPEEVFIASLNNAEKGYLELLKQGWKPEQAAELLPQATKADIVMTGFVSDWDHVFNLRARGKFTDSRGRECISIPHPEVLRLMKPLKDEFITRQWLRK